MKSTTETSSTGLPFLDVIVCFTETGIKKSLCRIPTDRPTYLMYRTFQPHDIKSSIVFSHLLMLKRMCSHILNHE